jgi:hypothetical protein
MTSIRKFAYAALLAATTLNFAPSQASAQEPARGRFTLTHDVRWENVTVPAGEYRFSFNINGISPVLSLNKISGEHTGFLLLVPTTEQSKPSDRSRLLLETTADGSYVSAMQLPEFGMTLQFAVPARGAMKQVAKGGSVASAGQ